MDLVLQIKLILFSMIHNSYMPVNIVVVQPGLASICPASEANTKACRLALIEDYILIITYFCILYGPLLVTDALLASNFCLCR